MVLHGTLNSLVSGFVMHDILFRPFEPALIECHGIKDLQGRQT